MRAHQIVVPHLVAEALVAAEEQDRGVGLLEVGHVHAVVALQRTQVLLNGWNVCKYLNSKYLTFDDIHESH